ncbi:protease inhibitor I9 family protein [Brevibacillus sp. M2.1A]|uniref:protease inhibitor I9 family protein n=1 Tax=Brevibacillus sp. M2.1A TaxID=2738980 RepID=UPI00156AD195|nr:protease inhibitor I9 family protein [Brevibacillus sp. M2.1A]MCC8438551.1 protease inhibitor I9 family protein [Brevibacillus sp. M2.1A]
MNKKKIALMVATTLVMGGSVSALGLTKPVEAYNTVQNVGILPYKISDELARKIEKASVSEKLPVIVYFEKSLNKEDYKKIEKEIGKISKKHTYEGVINGFAGDLTKKQISLLNNTSFVTLIDLDSVASTGDGIIVESAFSKGTDGWIGGFADYPEKDKGFYKLTSSLKTLPKEINSKQKGLYLSGYNGSDDLFMFVKKKLNKKDQLKPNTTYSVTFDFDIATNAGKNGMGVGGAAGESVFVKIGATKNEPIPVKEKLGFLRMNIDKGNQSEEGKDAFMIGNLSKTTTDNDKYELKPFNTEQRPFIVKTDKNAELWLLIGTDSAFEATTSIYIPRIKVTLKEVTE